MRSIQRCVLILLACAAFPAMAQGQASLSGVVTDTDGALVPGVTVTASSPALIENVRVSVTDAQGRYRIADLRPGMYTVVFTADGFATVRRGSVELTESSTVTINAETTPGPPQGWPFSIPPAFGFLYSRGGISASNSLPYERITLETHGCLVSCRRYKITLHRPLSGVYARAELEAVIPKGVVDDPDKERFPQRRGDFIGRINSYTYARLCYLLVEANFMELLDQYEATSSDPLRVTLTATSGGQTKSVMNADHFGPNALWGIEQAMEAIARSVKWTRK